MSVRRPIAVRIASSTSIGRCPTSGVSVGWRRTTQKSDAAGSRTTREIGIPMALGADTQRIVRPLVAGGLKLLVVGGVLGLAIAVAALRLLGGLLF